MKIFREVLEIIHNFLMESSCCICMANVFFFFFFFEGDALLGDTELMYPTISRGRNVDH